MSLTPQDAEQVRHALHTARLTFNRYAGLHYEKGTEEGDKKARANSMLAGQMNDALQTFNKFDVPDNVFLIEWADRRVGHPDGPVIHRSGQGLWPEWLQSYINTVVPIEHPDFMKPLAHAFEAAAEHLRFTGNHQPTGYDLARMFDVMFEQIHKASKVIVTPAVLKED